MPVIFEELAVGADLREAVDVDAQDFLMMKKEGLTGYLTMEDSLVMVQEDLMSRTPCSSDSSVLMKASHSA